MPTLSIDSIEVSDKVAGTATLTVTRSGAVYAASTVNFKSVPGSAEAGSDYSTVTGSISFAAGQTVAKIQIPILTAPQTQANVEKLETFTVVLSDPTDAIITNGTGTVSITADPVLPTLSIGNAEVSDKQAGNVSITVTRTGDLTAPSTVAYKTVAIPGSAQAGSDYTETTGTVTFAAGSSTAIILVPILANTTPLTALNRAGLGNLDSRLSGFSA